jgi:hypothetical protein
LPPTRVKELAGVTMVSFEELVEIVGLGPPSVLNENSRSLVASSSAVYDPKFRNSLLHYVVLRDNSAYVSYLLSQGYSPNHQNQVRYRGEIITTSKISVKRDISSLFAITAWRVSTPLGSEKKPVEECIITPWQRG